MNDEGIGSWPRRRARMSPRRRALVQDGVAVTYAELDHLVTAVRHGLAARGVRPGDRVAFLGLNSVELVVAMFATAGLGATFLPLNTRLAAPELRWILDDSEPRLLVHAADFDEVVNHPDVAALDLPLVRFTAAGGRGLEALARTPDQDLPEVAVGLDDVFMIQYTSGTSGRPKGVVLTHGNITWNAVNLLVDIDLTGDEVALVTAPLFHTAALNQVLLPTLLKGGTAIVAARFDPADALETIARDRVSLLFGVSSMYLALSQHPAWATTDLSSLRTAICGGAPVPRSLLETWQERGLEINQGYGLTEASPGATMLRPRDAEDKVGSAGTACFFTEVAVADLGSSDSSGAPLPGQPGEVLVRGPNVTPGYWRNDAATRAAFTQDGWLRTGDVAVVDEDGFFFIVDRVKDMYISGGENVYPAEVEQAIHTHPAVAEAAVLGVPDERWGEVGRAVVVLRPGAELTGPALLTHLEGRLARYKLPRSVVFVEDLPHNASGKLLKSRLRAEHGSPVEGPPR